MTAFTLHGFWESGHSYKLSLRLPHHPSFRNLIPEFTAPVCGMDSGIKFRNDGLSGLACAYYLETRQ